MGRLAVAIAVTLWAIPISMMVNHNVPEPYMDEIFHIPQAQQYCKGNFRSWDPMITTPPGLYAFSIVPLVSGLWWRNDPLLPSKLCSTAVLRSINCLLAVLSSVIVHDLFIHLRPSLSEREATVYTLVLALYPLHWFFTFLYYTDVASLTMVLAMYLASLRRHYWLSAVLGAMAVFIRQTNVIWMLFIAGVGAIDYALTMNVNYYKKCNSQALLISESEGSADGNVKSVSANLRKRKMHGSLKAADVHVVKANARFSSCFSGLLNELKEIIFALWCLKWKVLVSFTPFLLVLAAFVLFVIWNGGLVLGAKEAHTVSPHVTQILYFGVISAAAMAPVHFSLRKARALFKVFWMNKQLGFLVVLIGLLAGLISVHFFSIAHPYLLADNRHYPFYIWRKIINAHWLMKYLLVPLYVYSWLSIFSVLGNHQRKTWVLLFFLACAAVLIPAPLIEFRYYTTAFYFIILHSHIAKRRIWFFIAVLYMAVNIFTMVMFLYRPFYWDHEHGTQRFIW